MKANKNKTIKRNHKKWETTEMEIFNNFIKEHEEMLVSILYKNINKGMHLFRKTNGFFQKMSEKTNRSAAKCKSKFQKHEQKIYCQVLLVPRLHYNLFDYLRRNSLNKDNLSNSQSNNSSIKKFIDIKKAIDEFIENNGFQLDMLKGIHKINK